MESSISRAEKRTTRLVTRVIEYSQQPYVDDDDDDDGNDDGSDYYPVT